MDTKKAQRKPQPFLRIVNIKYTQHKANKTKMMTSYMGKHLWVVTSEEYCSWGHIYCCFSYQNQILQFIKPLRLQLFIRKSLWILFVIHSHGCINTGLCVKATHEVSVYSHQCRDPCQPQDRRRWRTHGTSCEPRNSKLVRKGKPTVRTAVFITEEIELRVTYFTCKPMKESRA